MELLQPVNVMVHVTASPRARTCIFATTTHSLALKANYLSELVADLRQVTIKLAHTIGDISGEWRTAGVVTQSNSAGESPGAACT